MRTFISGLALLGLLSRLACPAIGTSPTALTALPSSQENATIEGEPLYAVPTLRDRVGRLVAPVFVNGQGPFRFLLDTGATHTAITENAATRLGLTLLTSTRISVQGVNGNIEVPSVDVGELTAGKMWGLENQPAVLVGKDVLGTLSELSIDYRRQELQLVIRDAPLVRRL